MAVSDYDQESNGQGQGPLAPQGNSGGGGRALGKNWNELNQKQKDRFGSRSAFKDAKGEYNVKQNANNEAFTSTERSRKAGDKMKDLNQQLREAREDGQDSRVDKLQGRLDRQESRVYGDGTGSIADNYDASAGGKGSGTNKARTSGKDLKELEQRYGKQAVVDYMQGAGKDTLGGNKAQNLLQRYTDELTETPTPAPTPEATPEPTPEATNPTPTPAPAPTPTPTATDDTESEQTEETLSGGGIGIETTQTQSQTQTGGNDTVSGNDMSNNSGNITIDQSERMYGGDQSQTVINYAGDYDPTKATTVTDMTIAGHGKANDSPAEQARFVDMYQDLNAQAQKKYANVGTSTANQYIQNAAQTNPIDYVALNQEIGRSIERHYSNSTEQGAMYMGDPYNYTPPTYEMPEPLKPVENNVQETTENAQENMDDDD